jgi:methyl-accepting chemotaxis protein
MARQASVRKSILVSTGFGLLLLAVLLFMVWRGFAAATASSGREHATTQPALLAMLETRFNVVQIQQFLTDVSATADCDGFEDAAANFDHARRNLDALAKLLPELSQDAAEVRTLIEAFHAAGVRMAEAYISGGRSAGNAIMKEPKSGFDDRAEALTGRLQAMEQQVRARMTETAAATDSTIATSLWTSLGLGLGAALLSLLSGLLLYRSLLGMLGGEPRDAMLLAQRSASHSATCLRR